jgi:hypothetical protein
MSNRLFRVVLLAALALTACATPRESGSEVAVNTPGSLIVVAPLNLAIRAPEEITGRSEPVWLELLSYFQAFDHHVMVIEPGSARQLLVEAMLDLDTADPERALQTTRSRFARALAKHREYDLLVIPSLVLRPGRLYGQYAVWDGVQRIVPNAAEAIPYDLASDVHPPGSITVLGLRGKIAAVSLHVSVLSPDGTLVYEGMGGLDVIQEAHRENPWEGRWVFAMREDLFSEPLHLREGIEQAFEHPSPETARGPQGMKKELHLYTSEE